jgi:hypothetical protein
LAIGGTYSRLRAARRGELSTIAGTETSCETVVIEVGKAGGGVGKTGSPSERSGIGERGGLGVASEIGEIGGVRHMAKIGDHGRIGVPGWIGEFTRVGKLEFDAESV